MAIRFQVLGAPGKDNAVLVTADSGQMLRHFLYDCGQGCLDSVPARIVHQIDAVFFSHYHIDHIAGFDAFLRMNWYRTDSPVRVFGPRGTLEIFSHRLQGVTWNLVDDAPGEWIITEIDGSVTRSVRLLTREGFAVRHDLSEQDRDGDGVVYSTDEALASVREMDHGVPSLAWKLEEPERTNVDSEALKRLRLPPGRWINDVKQPVTDERRLIHVAGRDWDHAELCRQILTTSRGESIACLTDFCLSSSEDEDQLVRFLQGCETIVCENNYRDSDADLARANHHLTSSDVARIACRVRPRRLVLYHLSDRYSTAEWQELRADVRREFPQADFPEDWQLMLSESDSDSEAS